MKLAVLLLLALLVSRTARADEPTPAQNVAWKAGLTGYVFLAAWDGWMTWDCSRRGICHEANPVIRPFVDEHGTAAAMVGKVALQTGFAIALDQVRRRGHRKEAILGLAVLTVGQGYVVARNYRTLEGRR